jgi:siroheme synthase
MLQQRPLRAAAARTTPPSRHQRRRSFPVLAAATTTTTRNPLVTCYLVGAGPGPLDLLTLRAADCLRRADAVLFDDLGPSRRAAEALTPPHAALVPVGKRGGRDGAGAPKQRQINDELAARCADLLAQARADGRPRAVVRLKGGCPSVFSRAGSEIAALRAAFPLSGGAQEEEVAIELVPGVSSALAAPLLAGFPLTEGPKVVAAAQEAAQASPQQQQQQQPPQSRQPGFAVISGHGADSDPTWGSGLDGVAGVVVLMAGRALPAVVERLVGNARFSPDTPAAVIRDAGGGDGDGDGGGQQRVWRTSLGGLVEATRGQELSPCVVVVGECCAVGAEGAGGSTAAEGRSD